MLVLVHSGYVGPRAFVLDLCTYMSIKPLLLQKYDKIASHSRGPREPRRWVGGVSQGERLAAGQS